MDLERDSMYTPGASFFEDEGVVFFQFQADASSKIGPRVATKADKRDHEGAWKAFNEGRLPQLDHDKDGFPGGSLPDVEPPRRGRPPKPKE